MSDLIKGSDQFGTEVLKAAAEKENKRRSEIVLTVVQKIMSDHQNALDWAEENRRAVTFHAAQLKEIEQGDFTLKSDAYGVHLVFKTDILNKHWHEAREKWIAPQ